MKVTTRIAFSAVAAVIVVAGIIAAVVSAFAFGVFLGDFTGGAHKASECWLAHNKGYREGFDIGRSCKVGALGIRLGERCEVRGSLYRDNITSHTYKIEVWDVNRKDHNRVILEAIVPKDVEEFYLKRRGFARNFVGYETMRVTGTPAWVDGGEGSAGYSVDHIFVITGLPDHL